MNEERDEFLAPFPDEDKKEVVAPEVSTTEDTVTEETSTYRHEETESSVCEPLRAALLSNFEGAELSGNSEIDDLAYETVINNLMSAFTTPGCPSLSETTEIINDKTLSLLTKYIIDDLCTRVRAIEM